MASRGFSFPFWYILLAARVAREGPSPGPFDGIPSCNPPGLFEENGLPDHFPETGSPISA